mgnify:CR=1 FL=1
MKNIIIMAGLLFGSTICIQSQEMGFVIRVTPTLVYFDKGSDNGISIGDRHTVIRSYGDMYAPVADVSVFRIFPKFSIAEILKTYNEEDIDLLQWSIPTEAWLEIDIKKTPPLVENSKDEGSAPLVELRGRSSIYFFMGMDSHRNSDLKWSQKVEGDKPTILISSGKNNVSIIGLRLGQMITDTWRLGVTYRRSAGELQNLSIETDVNWLKESYRNVGPYLGVGLGISQLSIEPPAGSNARSSANKLLFNTMCGIHIPGTWNFAIEVGYQKVMAWGDLIDASSFRSYIGAGRNF